MDSSTVNGVAAALRDVLYQLPLQRGAAVVVIVWVFGFSFLIDLGGCQCRIRGLTAHCGQRAATR